MIHDAQPMALIDHLKKLYPEAFGETLQEKRSGLLEEILALWKTDQVICDVSPVLTEVLYEQADRDGWDFPSSVLQDLPALFYLHTGVGAAQGLPGQEGIFVRRESLHQFCFLAVGEDGGELFHVRLLTGAKDRTLEECLAESDEAMRPVLARWLEVLMYLAAENREMEEDNYYFLLPGKALPQRIRSICVPAGRWEKRLHL